MVVISENSRWTPRQIACGPRGSSEAQQAQDEARDQQRAIRDGQGQEEAEHRSTRRGRGGRGTNRGSDGPVSRL